MSIHNAGIAAPYLLPQKAGVFQPGIACLASLSLPSLWRASLGGKVSLQLVTYYAAYIGTYTSCDPISN